MKGWIINYTTLKDGKYKGWGMYITADSITSAILAAETIIKLHPERYDCFIITNAGIADGKPAAQKWEEKWSQTGPEDF